MSQWSMPSSARPMPGDPPADPPPPDVAEFIRFCHDRKHVGWPELYDEMCAVAAYEAARAAQAHVNALVAEVMQHVFTLGVNPDVLGFHFDNGGRDDKA